MLGANQSPPQFTIPVCKLFAEQCLSRNGEDPHPHETAHGEPRRHLGRTLACPLQHRASPLRYTLRTDHDTGSWHTAAPSAKSSHSETAIWGDTVLNYFPMFRVPADSALTVLSQLSPLTLSYPDSLAKRDVVRGHRAGYSSGN